MAEKFSFRWGINVLDSGQTQIPNIFFDHYHNAVSYKEFALILHLARYQFERPGAQSKPSLATIAVQMGISVDAVRRSLKALEKRGLLTRHYRQGQTTIYDFSGFSKAVMAHAWTQDTLCKNDTPGKNATPCKNAGTSKNAETTPCKNAGTPLAKMQPEEEQQENNKKVVVDILQSFGVSLSMAQKLARIVNADEAQKVIDYAEKNDLTAGYVVSAIRNGDIPGDEPKPEPKQKEFPVCPSCSLVKYKTHFCPECGRCWDCCEC